MKSIIVILATFMSLTAFTCPMNDTDVAKKSTKKVEKSENSKSPKYLSPYFAMHAILIKDVLPSKKDVKLLEDSLTKQSASIKDADAKKELKKALKIIKAMKGNDITKLRENFYELSKVLIPFTKKYKLIGVQAYYCPMAKKSWLQNQSEITYNPYMPKQMLHCGSKI
jgi:hypothetical protein